MKIQSITFRAVLNAVAENKINKFLEEYKSSAKDVINITVEYIPMKPSDVTVWYRK